MSEVSGGWATSLLDAVPVKRVPLLYRPPLQQTFVSTSQVKVYRVPMDCTKLHDAEVVVCAELVDNWEWILKNGVVVMDLFNQPNVDNVSL